VTEEPRSRANSHADELPPSLTSLNEKVAKYTSFDVRDLEAVSSGFSASGIRAASRQKLRTAFGKPIAGGIKSSGEDPPPLIFIKETTEASRSSRASRAAASSLPRKPQLDPTHFVRFEAVK